jgi:hypothetical protein
MGAVAQAPAFAGDAAPSDVATPLHGWRQAERGCPGQLQPEPQKIDAMIVALFSHPLLPAQLGIGRGLIPRAGAYEFRQHLGELPGIAILCFNGLNQPFEIPIRARAGTKRRWHTVPATGGFKFSKHA